MVKIKASARATHSRSLGKISASDSKRYYYRLAWIWLVGFSGLTALLGSIRCLRLQESPQDSVPIELTIQSFESSFRSLLHWDRENLFILLVSIGIPSLIILRAYFRHRQWQAQI